MDEKLLKKHSEHRSELHKVKDYYWLIVFLTKNSDIGKDEIREELLRTHFPKYVCTVCPQEEWYKKEKEKFLSDLRNTGIKKPEKEFVGLDRRIALKYSDINKISAKSGWNKPLSKKVNFKVYCLFVKYMLSTEVIRTWLNFQSEGCCNIPKGDNKQFCGRERELKDLFDHFNTQKNTVIGITGKPLALYSNGGQGKTALAKEYAQRNHDTYGATLFIDGTAGSVTQNLISILSSNKYCGVPEYVPENHKDEQELAYYLRLQSARFLNKKTLIIIDDLRNPTELQSIAKQLSNDHVHIIFTQRKGERGNKIKIENNSKMIIKFIKLQPLNEYDSGELFIGRTNIKDLNPLSIDVQKLVTKTLGGHALSICLVSAYTNDNPELSLIELIQRLNIGISKISEGVQLADYDPSIKASFYLSFDSKKLNKGVKLVLMLMTLFPRGPLSKELLREIVLDVKTIESKYLHEMKKVVKQKEFLVQARLYDLLQDVGEGVVSLHEIVYDLLQDTFKECLVDPKIREIKEDFIRAVAEKGKTIIDEHQNRKDASDFLKTNLRSITGLLTPAVNKEREIVPDSQWLKISADFWFENYRFHQFIYDSQVLDELEPRIEALVEYLKDNDRYHGISLLVFNKILGHALYANPKDKEKVARGQRIFQEALDEIENLLATSEENIALQATLKWYQIFLIDHMVNMGSKIKPSDNEDTKPISARKYLGNWITTLEGLLPKSLGVLSSNISPSDYPLILRTAHYWGHRGNQDQYTFLTRVVKSIHDKKTIQLANTAKEHYVKAANLRLLSLRISERYRSSLKESVIDSAITKAPYIEKWITEYSPLENIKNIEDFSNFHQGINDIAHQIRGINFIDVLYNVIALTSQSVPIDIEKMDNSYQCADNLWHAPHKRGKVLPIRYILWMCSSKVLNDEVKNIYIGNKLRSWSEVEQHLMQRVEEMQKDYSIEYIYVVKEQTSQTKRIWSYLYNQGNRA